MIKLDKPKSFYNEFTRKGAGQKVTHYCPGCGHGNVHKFIAEAVDDFGIQDRTVFLSPVGCAAFGYYYFDTGNVACAHGRAPAVGTGVIRSRKDAVVISYQGDGDLGGIGAAEIIHAANRGEHMAVFFINNAIYGMTGGQMAPTTLLGQKTATTPFGRTEAREGGPIKVCEMLNEIEAPVYIERVSLADGPSLLKARKAVRKALKNQVERKGFSLVEILSPCPINWKMSPSEAREWIKSTMEKEFPVKKFRDREPEADKSGEDGFPWAGESELLNLLGISEDETIRRAEKKIEDQFIKVAGFGGQGVMSAGILLANCAIHEGINAAWLPSYGPEMRGGSANASVVISERMIGSPVVDNPSALLAMNGPSLDRFEETVRPGGIIIVNSSLISREVGRSDVKVIRAPVTDLANDAGFLRGANIIIISLYLLSAGQVTLRTLEEVIPLSLKKQEFRDINIKMIKIAEDYFRNHV
ncbi:MAG: 2-oxoacid:acceptor oxidoreductase family protein [Spirochaetia bacterium]